MRTLRADERSTADDGTDLPLVVEPTGANDLAAACAAHGDHLLRLLDDGGGALLLRGWSVDSEEDFERAMARLPLRPIADYFPAEPGRRPPAAAGKCWQTNSLKTTGGYIGGEVLPHTECYYALEPPTYAAFCCLRAPWLGGQTALFDGAGALASLPMATRRRIERSACAVRRTLSLRRLGRRHGVVGAAAVGALRRACAAGGVRLDALGDGHVQLTFQKPSVVVAGSARRRHLCVNFGECGARARRALLDALRARGLFGGRAWAAHRLAWAAASRWPLIRKLISLIDELPGWLRQPRRMLALRAERQAAATAAEAAADGDGWPTLGETLGAAGGVALGVALGAHASVFAWRAGDVLLIDNRRVMHDGLPGFGPRQLRALFFDAFEMPQAMERRGSGVFDAG